MRTHLDPDGELSLASRLAPGAGYGNPPFRSALWSLTAVLLAAAASFSPMATAPLLWLLLGAPLAEETLFRTGLQAALMRRGVGNSAVWVAVAFAAAHLLHQAPGQAALTAIPALGIGLVFTRTQRLWDCIALHALCNACWVLGGVA